MPDALCLHSLIVLRETIDALRQCSPLIDQILAAVIDVLIICLKSFYLFSQIVVLAVKEFHFELKVLCELGKRLGLGSSIFHGFDIIGDETFNHLAPGTVDTSVVFFIKSVGQLLVECFHGQGRPLLLVKTSRKC
jgi:hypothetical protein